MIRRCADPTFKDWHLYGGKTPAIAVCERWAESCEAFAADMGIRPLRHTLERKDSNGPYSPENCKWATGKEQGRNTSRCVYYEVGGKRLTIAELAERTGLKYLTIFQRLKRGMTIHEAVATPLMGKGSRWQKRTRNENGQFK